MVKAKHDNRNNKETNKFVWIHNHCFLLTMVWVLSATDIGDHSEYISSARLCYSSTIKSFSFYCHSYRAFSLTWPAAMQIYWNKRTFLHKKRVQLPQDWFGTPTWPPFHYIGTPIWLPWRHTKTLYVGSLIAEIQFKAAKPQRQTDEWCRICCRPGSVNYFLRM